MLSSWLNLLAKGRAPRHNTHKSRLTLCVEELESRITPKVTVWTGNVIAIAGGLGANSINAAWSNGGNWSNGKPANGDDVIFPTGLDSAHKPPATTNPFKWDINSLVDYSVTLNNLTINDDNFRIDSNIAETLTITGTITTNIPETVGTLTGVSMIGNWQIGATQFLSVQTTGNSQQLIANNNGVLDITSAITTSPSALGQVGFDKEGLGTMELEGNNNFDGGVNVGQGILMAGGDFNNNTSLGSTANPVQVQNGATLGVNDSANFQKTVNIVGNGVPDAATPAGQGALAAVNDPLLTFEGGGGGATATWNGAVTMQPSASIGSVGFLTINGLLSGAGDLTSVGAGTVRLADNNTFAGNVFIKQGILSITAPNALGPAVGAFTRVFTGAQLSVDVSMTVAPELLFLNGDGYSDANQQPFGALRMQGAAGTAATWTGSVTLESNSSIGENLNNTMTITGQLIGQPNLRKTDQGTLIMPVANTSFSGNTSIENGVLIMEDPQALGPATGSGANPGGAITVKAGTASGGGFIAGTLELLGTFNTMANEFMKALSINGAGFNSLGALYIADGGSPGSTVFFNAPITLTGPTTINIDPKSALKILQGISGGAAAALQKSGTGELDLAVDSTYLGPTTLTGGLTVMETAGGLGAPGNGGATVFTGATLQLLNPMNVVGVPLTLSGFGTSNQGALYVSTPGNYTWNGLIDLQDQNGVATAFINVVTGANLNFPNVLSGNANLEKIGGGELDLTGTLTNTFINSTQIDQGTLGLGKSAGVTALSGAVTVGNGVGLPNSAVLLLLNSGQLPVSEVIAIESNGLFNLNNFSETVSGLTFTGGNVVTGTGLLTLAGNITTNVSTSTATINGNLSLGSATRTFNVAGGANPPDLQINGTISGGPGAGLIKAGTGVMALNGANTYSGPTTVNGGTLRLLAANALPNTALSLIAGTFDVNGQTVTVPEVSAGPSGILTLGGGSFTFGTDNSNQLFSGTISGTNASNLIKVGSGTETFNGVGTGFQGTLSVNGGTAVVNSGSFGNASVIVNNTGTLTGTGMVGNVNVTAGGTLRPGSNPGTLTTGQVTITGASTYIEDLDGAGGGQYGILHATGNVSLGNGISTLQVNLGYSPNLGDSYTILTTTGNLTGTFANLPNLGTFAESGRVFRVTYTGTSVVLTAFARQGNISLTSNLNPSTPGQNVVFTVTVSPIIAGDPIPTGSVTLFDGANQIGGPTPLNGAGKATFTVPFSTIGLHTITAIYTSTNSYQTPTATLSPPQDVQTSSVTTLQSLNAPSVIAGNPLGFIARVAGIPGGPIPTGTITFENATTGQILAIVGLDAAGGASLNLSSLPVGTSTLIAVYSGDSDYLASSGTVKQTITPLERIAVGSGEGAPSLISVYDTSGNLLTTIDPFNGYQGGIKVAVGDVTGDGVADIIVGAGPGAPGGHIKIYDGQTFQEISSFFAFPGFTGGVSVAAGNVAGGGVADIIIGTTNNNDHVEVRTLTGGEVMSFFAFGPNNPVGVTVGAGDVEADGRSDVIVGSATGMGQVEVFQALTGTMIQSYTPFAGYTGGIFVAAGDVNGDGHADVIVGSATGDSHVAVFDGVSEAEILSFIAYPGAGVGVHVGAVDLFGNGVDDILTGPAGTAPHVKAYNGAGALDLSFISEIPGQPTSQFGIYVAGGTGK